MGRFGEYLVQQGLLSATQIEEAISHQSVYGDRLGTNLVDLHMLSPEQLAEYLAGYHQVPLPPRKWLERPRKPALKRVTRPLVERIRFIPLRLDGNVMHAAVLDPRDPSALDDLRFATGCRIKPYVLPEIWMHDWLFSLFKIPRGIRHVETFAAAPAGARAGEGGFDVRAAQHEQVAAQLGGAVASVEALAAASAGAHTASGQAQRASGAAGMPELPSVAMAAQAPAPTAAGGFDPAVRVAPPATAAQSALSDPLAVAQAVAPRPREPFAPAPSRGALPPEPGLDWAPQAVAEAPVPSVSGSSVPGASVRPPEITVRSLADLANAIGVAGLAGQERGGQPFVARVSGQAVPSLWDAPAARERAWPVEPAAFDMEPPLAGLPVIPSAPRVPFEVTSPSIPFAPADSVSPAARRPSLVDAVAPTPLVTLERALLEADGRDALIEAALSIAGRFAYRLGLFIVQQGIVQGARYVEGGRERALDGVLVPVDTPCLLSEAVTSGEPLRVTPSGQALDNRILQLMSDEDAKHVGVLPVHIKGRVVNVLYASNGSAGLGAVAFAALSALAEQMGAAYERLILARKR